MPSGHRSGNGAYKAVRSSRHFPDAYFDDALHVAIASVNGIAYLLSWNFKHLAKVKTRRMVALANVLAGYPAVEIIAPPEL